MSTRENESGYAYLFDPEIEKNIRELKEKGLPVIVVCHAGAEGFQYPLPEIRDTYRCLIDYGADVIIAHHPHVPQGVERYKGKKIYYSLGNFAFDKGNGALNPNTYCVIVNIENCELVNTDILFTTYADGKVDVLDDKDEIKKILALDSYLKDDNYSQYIAEVNEFCLNKYHNNYLRCYQRVPYVYDGAIGILKGLFRRIVQRKKMNEVMLFHNIEIETHFWIVRRALRLKMGNLVH